MITKWFIGVNAKSKGFFTGWQYSYGGKAKPSFTKQSALATSFDTEDDANEQIAKYLKESTNELNTYTKKLKTIQDAKRTWLSKTQQEKMMSIASIGISVKYDRPERTWLHTGHLYINRSEVLTKTLTDEEAKGLDNMDWEPEIKKVTNEITLYKNRIEFINTKLMVREQDLEIKFKDSERRKIGWSQRSENDTSNGYCNCCGGAVPSIPQLIIGSGKRYGTGLIICAICMSKLAQEAEIQAGKISDEIMEHYQTDRFIRSLD